MNAPSWTDVVQALAASGSLLVTILGFLFLIRQVRQLERTIRGDTNANLCSQSIEILKEISSCPDGYRCFYENAPLPGDEKIRIEVLCICEMIANFLDHVALQRDNLPPPVWERWSNFIRDTLSSSQVMQEHFSKFRGWYSLEIIRFVDEIPATKPQHQPS